MKTEIEMMQQVAQLSADLFATQNERDLLREEIKRLRDELAKANEGKAELVDNIRDLLK